MIEVDSSTCKACGICGRVCPRHITETVDVDGGKRTVVSAERAALCMSCGHCAAVCPTGSIAVDGLDPNEFGDPVPLQISREQILTLFRQRRSIRRYKDRPVPREVLDQIVQAASAAPTGTGSMSTQVIVVDGQEKLREMMKHVYTLYEKLEGALKNPIARFFIKRRVGARMLNTLDAFVMPGMRWYIRWHQEGTSDEIRRDCPALMLFCGPIDEPMVDTNCAVAALHAIFLAQTLGVGTCFNDLIPPACNRSPDLRQILALAPSTEVYTAVTLGYPKYDFKRTIPRKLAEARYLD